MSARKDGRTPKPVAPIADVAAALTLRETNLLRYHPVMIAISKARAARYLIGLADDENLPAHDACLTPEQRNEHIEWIKSFALEALASALDEAEAAFLKSSAAPALRAEVLGGTA